MMKEGLCTLLSVNVEHQHYDEGRGLRGKLISPYIITRQLGATQKAAVRFQCESRV